MAIRFGRCLCLAGACLVACACSIGKTRKQVPTYMREHHAGTADMPSVEAARIIYDRLLLDAQKCYAGGAIGGIMPAGPLFIPIMGPARQVEGVFNDAADAGVIRTFIDGNVYLPMFQIDVNGEAAGSRITIYYSKDVSMHRRTVENLKAWLAGNDAACAM